MVRRRTEKKIVNIYVDPEDHKALRRIALERDQTLQKIMEGLIGDFLANQDEDQGKDESDNTPRG